MSGKYYAPSDAVRIVRTRRGEFAKLATGFSGNKTDVAEALRWAARQAEKLPAPASEPT